MNHPSVGVHLSGKWNAWRIFLVSPVEVERFLPGAINILVAQGPNTTRPEYITVSLKEKKDLLQLEPGIRDDGCTQQNGQ